MSPPWPPVREVKGTGLAAENQQSVPTAKHEEIRALTRHAGRHRRAHRVRDAVVMLPLACVAVVVAISGGAVAGLGALPRPAVGADAAVRADPPVAAAAAAAVVAPAAPTAPAQPGAASPTVPPVAAIVGLGDSVPAGTGCGCDNFIDLLGADQSGAAAASTRNAARNGLTSAGLLEQLHESEVGEWTRRSDVTVVTIGANDFDSADVADDRCAAVAGLACFQPELRALRTNVSGVLAMIRQLHRGGSGRVLVTGYWNVFLDGDVGRAQGSAYVANSDALTRAVNAVLQDVAEQAGDEYVDLYGAFKADGPDDTGLLAADGDHPSAAGHRLIADLIDRLLASGVGPVRTPA